MQFKKMLSFDLIQCYKPQRFFNQYQGTNVKQSQYYGDNKSFGYDGNECLYSEIIFNILFVSYLSGTTNFCSKTKIYFNSYLSGQTPHTKATQEFFHKNG